MHYAVLGLGIVLLATALLALAGLVALADGSWFLQWQALIGALLGSAGTIFAGWLTRAVVLHREARAAKRLSGEPSKPGGEPPDAKASAVSAITEPVQAAGVALAALRRAVAASGDPRSKQHLADAIARLATTVGSLKPASDLNPNDRALYLMIVTHLTSVANVGKNPSGATSPELRLRHLVRALENAHRHIAMFDAPLGQKFAEASAAANLDVHDPGRRMVA
jgi:hypothetical protein